MEVEKLEGTQALKFIHHVDSFLNMRGINKFKHKEMKMFLREHKVSLIAKSEYRVQNNKASKILNKVMPGWSWCTNASYASRGRI